MVVVVAVEKQTGIYKITRLYHQSPHMLSYTYTFTQILQVRHSHSSINELR